MGTVSGFALGGENFCWGGGGQLKLSRECRAAAVGAAKRVGLNELPANHLVRMGQRDAVFGDTPRTRGLRLLGAPAGVPVLLKGNAPRCFVALFLLEALICRRRNFAGGGRS
jgi:hypothetical protein